MFKNIETMSRLKLLLVLITHALITMAVAEEDAASTQSESSESVGVMSTSAGAKVDIRTANSTLDRNLIRDTFFLESITHFVREKIPERIVHAKGTGGFGYFEVTHDISDICKAKLFSEVGKQTPIAVRFSLFGTRSDGADTLRDTRGFSVKFYTEDGNLDILGLATPIFPFKDPVLFPSFAHAQGKNPETHVLDPNTLWDFLTLHPESFNAFLFVFGDRGVPFGYRFMPGFAIHTYQIVNADGDSHFVRFHFTPDAGIKDIRSADAIQLGGSEPDYAIKDLYNAIDAGDYPSWTLGVQILSEDDVKNATFDVFDITKELPLDQYPLSPVGKLVLNENPRNAFAQIEQLAFCPGNLVPGLLGGPDKLFEARVLSYRDAQNYRLGANFNKIKVNKPIDEPSTYNRDGVPPVDDNELDQPNYYPNSFNGPQPYVEQNKVDLISITEEAPNNFDQFLDIYTNQFTEDERTRLAENIVASLSLATTELQERAIGIFDQINPDLSSRVSEGLQTNTTTSFQFEPLEEL